MRSGLAIVAGMRTPSSSSYRYQRLLLLLFSSLLVIQGSSHGGGKETQRSEAEEQQRQVPQPIERAIGRTVTGKQYGRSDSSVGTVVKEAASKSFKETVEHTAETALEVAEKAVHKTKEKMMKRTAPTPGGKPDAEL